MNIYVGNLAFSTTDHDLRQLFEPYGVVDEIRVITDRDTGRSKGFGFVAMPDGTAARRRWPSSRARRWRAGPSRSMRPSRVNRAVRPAGPAGSPPRGMPLRAPLSQDGHPLGVAVGVFVQNFPPAG